MTIWTSSHPWKPIGDSLTEVLSIVFTAGGERIALVDASTGETVTCAQLHDRARSAAAWHRTRDVGPGSTVLMVGPNSVAWAACAFGALAAGATVATASPATPVADLVGLITMSEARAVWTIDPLVEPIASAAAAAGLDVVVWSLATDLTAAAHDDFPSSSEPDLPPPDPDAVAFVLFSSGTTGRPKGVEITQRAMAGLCAQLVEAMPALDETSVFANPLPFFHAGGLWTLLGPLARGIPVITLPAFDLLGYCELVARYRVTHSVLVPPALVGLTKHPAVAGFDLSSLVFVASAAAPCGAELQRAASDALGCPVGQGYGMTEAGIIAISVADDIVPGGTGRLVPGVEAIVVDPDTGERLGVDTAGELWVRGPSVMRGYRNDPGATAATLVDGWLRTGDIVTIDDAGELQVVDRLKELIKTNGYQVAPAELEDLLVGLPGVVAAAVVPRPHPTAGEVPVAYAVLAPDTDPDGVLAAVEAKVARYKRLADLVSVDEIPTSPTGKILRRVLVEREREAVASAAGAVR